MLNYGKSRRTLKSRKTDSRALRTMTQTLSPMHDDLPDKVYSVSETAQLVGISPHLLRQWEKRFPTEVKPRRNSANHRMYSREDIISLMRIKTLLYHNGMTAKGARQQLRQERFTDGQPRDISGMARLIDAIADESRAILNLFDPKVDELIPDQDDAFH